MPGEGMGRKATGGVEGKQNNKRNIAVALLDALHPSSRPRLSTQNKRETAIVPRAIGSFLSEASQLVTRPTRCSLLGPLPPCQPVTSWPRHFSKIKRVAHLLRNVLGPHHAHGVQVQPHAQFVPQQRDLDPAPREPQR